MEIIVYKTKLTASKSLIDVTTKSGKNFHYATDGSLANPLEATFAALAGCAGVYTLKACKDLGVSAEGIEIETIPKKNLSQTFNVFGVNAFLTNVHFPEHFTSQQKEVILESIKNCAVKELMKNGNIVEFSVEEV